jgi:esterase/lipase
MQRPHAPLEARHRSSGLNSRFAGDGLSFADYVTSSREMLAQAHVRLGSSAAERRVEDNAPFELKPAAGFPSGREKPYRRGVLLTHGLTDSPYFMRHLAAFFAENGFRVMAPLLPGHGTQPGDLLDIEWQEWSRVVAYGADRLAEEVDELYLAGYSAGGSLSLCHGLHDKRVRGLFLFSPALQISHRAAYARLHRIYSWLLPAAAWLEVKPDRDIYKYESFPKNAAAQMYALTRELDNRLQRHEVNVPVFAAASADDVTVNTSATLEFIARNPAGKLVLYTTDMAQLPPDVPAERLELMNSRVPEQNILSSAHTAIVLPPDDAHYGVRGDYSNCAHYHPDDMQKFAACLQHPEQDLQGELTDENLKAGVLRRLMYNPHFATLKISMQRFIESLP